MDAVVTFKLPNVILLSSWN